MIGPFKILTLHANGLGLGFRFNEQSLAPSAVDAEADEDDPRDEECRRDPRQGVRDLGPRWELSGSPWGVDCYRFTQSGDITSYDIKSMH